MPISFKMLAAAAALSSTMMMFSARFAEPPKEATSAEKPMAAFEDRWQGANHAVLLAAVASGTLAEIAAPPAAEQTVGRVQIAEATAADIEQFEAEKRARATRDGICALGKRYYNIGRHQYWRCKRR